MEPNINKKKIEHASVLILAVICLIGGITFGYITAQIKNFSGIENLKQFQPSIPTKLYDVNGELIAELFQEKRDIVAFENLPQNLINAFIATEDRDFYRHFGINPMAIMRAMVKNVMALKIVQGGSTITQQLAKRLFTTGERTLLRKALEAVLTLQIEKKFSKEEILEMYFNQIYLGHGCYGISAAAKLFFEKEVRNLNVAESTILSALPSAPGRNSPLLNARTAYEVNRGILSRMVDAGFLDQARSDKIYNEFWPVYIESIKMEYPSKTVFSKNIDKAPFFTDYVRQILTARFGRDAIYNEGLSVYTTLNLKRQEIGQKLMQEGVRKQDEYSSKANVYYLNAVDRSLFGAYNTLRMVFSLPAVEIKNDFDTIVKKHILDELLDTTEIITLLADAGSEHHCIEKFREAISGISSSMHVEGAMIAIEPPSGYITTMIGGSEFTVDNQYNRALQAKRQPGSSFKPFVYGAGIESRVINAGMALPDAPLVDIGMSGESWSPANYEGDFTGMVRLRKALAASINIISVRIYDLVGPDRVINYASKMLKVSESRFTPGPSLALGTTEVTPFEMATGFAIYANRGRDVIPFAVRYVIDRDGNELANIEEEVGNIIAAKEKDGTIQIISEPVACIMTSMMQSVVDSGTPYEAIRLTANFKHKCAGKTGTTSNWSDAWFCGFTPDIAAVVWLGYDKPFMTLGKHQAAAATAAPIWGHYMREVYNGMKEPVFPPEPPGIYHGGVCSFTGLVPGKDCPVVADLMLKGSGPGKECDGVHDKMRSVLERYMEKQGLSGE
jgi:penicillin-binding protein 1A